MAIFLLSFLWGEILVSIATMFGIGTYSLSRSELVRFQARLKEEVALLI